MKAKKKKGGLKEFIVGIPKLDKKDQEAGVYLKPGEPKEITGLVFRWFLEERGNNDARKLKARKELWGRLVGIAERARVRDIQRQQVVAEQAMARKGTQDDVDGSRPGSR